MVRALALGVTFAYLMLIDLSTPVPQPGGLLLMGFQFVSVLGCDFEGNVGGAAALTGD